MFSHPSVITSVLGAQKNRLIETVLLSTHNICFGLERRKFIFDEQNFERKIVNVFLSISYNISFWCAKEPSHWDSSFEYPQHMFWFRNKKIIFDLIYTLIFMELSLSIVLTMSLTGL